MKRALSILLVATIILGLLASGISCTETVYVVQTPISTPTATPTSTPTPEPYPQAHLKLLGVYSDQECSQPVSMFDFGSVAFGYSRGILLPIYLKNLTGATFSVTAEQSEDVTGGYVTLDAAPPKWYTNRDIDPGKTEKFLLLFDIIGTPPPQEFSFTVTITARFESGGDFEIVFPAKLVVY